METELVGKTVVLTGTTSRIGRAIVLATGDAGLCVIARDKERLKRLQLEVKQNTSQFRTNHATEISLYKEGSRVLSFLERHSQSVLQIHGFDA